MIWIGKDTCGDTLNKGISRLIFQQICGNTFVESNKNTLLTDLKRENILSKLPVEIL